jgi:hypothetical protein
MYIKISHVASNINLFQYVVSVHSTSDLLLPPICYNSGYFSTECSIYIAVLTSAHESFHALND